MNHSAFFTSKKCARVPKLHLRREQRRIEVKTRITFPENQHQRFFPFVQLT